ncbi:hypothetical protein N7463_003107 [Penicillium fimorum]|uniref:RBR-type E3 ubiquitin transferase n=1 Tax=Penicillium fimorum TaxID=1882269 RepID=A0A9W9Y1T0_9EURO|nr:hypothetical protein N7463_003107 [Penicillium fimorum]
MDLNTTDLETADFVLQTALQEVEELLRSSSRNGNYRRVRIDDRNRALLQWRTDLRVRRRTQQDRRAAIQISRQSRFSQAAIIRDIRNRELNRAPAPNPDAQVQARQRADVTSTATVPPSGVLRECVACSDSHPESNMIENSCSHVYCQGCVIRLLQNSLADESLFPPRCCRLPLPLGSARGIIDDALWERFEEKSIEHGDQSRTYCSNPACSRYILPTDVHGTIGTCRSCNQQTCTHCKRTTHQGECVDNRAEVLELARAEGWQRCSNCSHLVELHSGCNHITCRCQHEFCYVCAIPWKQCECAHWDEARLQERAELIAARNQRVHPPPMIAITMLCGKGSISPLNVRNVATGCLISFSNAGIVDSKPAGIAECIGSN